MLLKRPRRNRKGEAIRNLLQESVLRKEELIVPLFVKDWGGEAEGILTLPGIERLSIEGTLKQIEKMLNQGLHSFLLFPCIQKKDERGSQALLESDVIPQSVLAIKRHFPSACVFTDIALDPYTAHGHDGLINEKQEVLNDETVEVLAQVALLHARCGADVVCPSDMMDGRVKAIRQRLDAAHFSHVSILSYAAKYASALYGPFRDALQSGLKKGDKKGYQLNPANVREALLEAHLDEEEGADMLLIKPATFYLDVLYRVKQKVHLPVGAYHVSGEYAMIMAAAEKGMIDKERGFLEALLSIKRAGADFIISYAIPQILHLL